MGLNPTILGQGRAFVFLLSPSVHPAVPRRPYRAGGFVLGRDLAVARRPLDGRTPRRPSAICYVRSTSQD